MSTTTGRSPGFMPVLSAGKHRTSSSGGCFMEFASWLAGERWSDHPACTHPALAALARLVNDSSSDEERSRLAPLIPSVIGMNGDDTEIGLAVAVRAAAEALPVASEQRQRALAVGLLSCERILTERGVIDSYADRIEHALAAAPHAAAWSREFVTLSRTVTRPRAAARVVESVTRIAVIGIAQACVVDTDERLRRLLAAAIDDVRAVLARTTDSAEDRVPGAGALEFEESVERSGGDNAVPQRQRLLPLGRR